MKLPAKVIVDRHVPTGIVTYGWTAAQVTAYGNDRYQQGLEDAAKVCDSIHPGMSTAFVAEAILKLKEKA
jgi:hypothetical protein